MENWPFETLTPKSYAVIYCDPPWAFKGYSSSGVPQRAKEQHYKTLTFQDMAQLPIGDLAMSDCALCMWSISSHTQQAFELAKHWGFNFSSKLFTWAKLNKHAEKNFEKRYLKFSDCTQKNIAPKISDNTNWRMGMGHGTRRNTEDCWLFMKGKPKRISRAERELIVAPIREHSRKPNEAYERVENLFNGPYCELFSREDRAGWSTWGDEAGKFK